MRKIIAIVFAFFFVVSTSANTMEIKLRIGSGHPTGLLGYTKTAHEWFAPELKKRIEKVVASNPGEAQAIQAGLRYRQSICRRFSKDTKNGNRNFSRVLAPNAPSCVHLNRAVMAGILQDRIAQ